MAWRLTWQSGEYPLFDTGTCSGILDGPERRGGGGGGCTSSAWKLWKIGHSTLHGVFWGCLSLGANEGHFQAIIKPIKAFFYSS